REDGVGGDLVTGVRPCALPILVQRYEVAIAGRVVERLLSRRRRLLLVDVELDRDVRIVELGVGRVDRIAHEDELFASVFENVIKIGRASIREKWRMVMA